MNPLAALAHARTLDRAAAPPAAPDQASARNDRLVTPAHRPTHIPGDGQALFATSGECMHALTTDARARCGVRIDPRDHYQSAAAGQRVWASGLIPHCGNCEIILRAGGGV